jgi:hypothetical protein
VRTEQSVRVQCLSCGLSEQFPTALRGRGHFFAEATARFFARVVTPFLLEPHVGSAPIFFGTITVVVAIGACVPLLFGKETVGQLEMITGTMPDPEFVAIQSPPKGS